MPTVPISFCSCDRALGCIHPATDSYSTNYDWWPPTTYFTLCRRLFIKNPSKSIPHLLTSITKFGNISGFTVNWEKSDLMTITPYAYKQHIKSSPFKITENSFTYLGVIITKNPRDLLRVNWQKRIDQLKNNIDYWRTLPISMVGKINAVKMVSLPRFLHLFQSIPSCIPQSYFKQLDKITIQFLWNYKTARIKKQHLCKSKEKGGFGLPFFKAYYWAVHLNMERRSNRRNL